ncbi:MAG: ABC transporter [Myxococcales bacterium]|nr:ABC transporter [Myxococcales bacterium]
MSFALSLNAVSKSFGALHVLRGVDLRVPTGTVFGLVGPNGAGKTTLFSIISGYLRADQGSIEMFGQVIEKGRPPSWGRFGILPQDAALLPRSTIAEQLTLYAMLQGLTEDQAKQDCDRVLSAVQLAEVAPRKPTTLSHGMHKRVGIAQAFLGSPELVILDEPTAGLDPNAARSIRNWIRVLSESCTVIVSSHNLSEIEDLCDEVAILHQGTIVQQHTVSGVVAGAASLLIRPEREPTAKGLAAIDAMPFVIGVQWSSEGGRIAVEFNRDMAAPSVAARELISLMIELDLPFVELQIGKSLEERFIEQTNTPG